MIRIAKYKFDSKEQVQKKIEFLGTAIDEDGNEYPTHKHTIVNLGNIVLEQAVIDENGEIEIEAVLSKDWHVDVLWKDIDNHPYGWKSYAVDIDGDGVHAFLGLSYDSLKF